jgi:hypothetical protein
MGSGWGIGLAFVGFAPEAVEGGGDGNHIRTPATVALQFTEATPSAEIDHFRDVGIDELQFTGNTPSAEIDHFRDVGIDELQFTGYEPTLSYSWTVFPDKDELQFTGYEPTLDYTWVVFPDKDDLQFTGYEPTLAYSWVVFPDIDELQFTGYEPKANVSFVVFPDKDELQITGAEPSAEINHFRDVGIDELQFAGYEPTLAYSWTVFPDKDDLQITGAEPTVRVSLIALPGTGSLSIAQPENISIVGTPQSGTNIDGADVTLTFDGSPAENDYVLVAGGHGSGSSTLDAPGSGYTEIWSDPLRAAAFGVWYKKLGATPDASVVCDGGGNVNDSVAYISYVLRGVDPSTFEDVATQITAQTNSTNPDAPSITPQTVGAWVFAIAGNAVADSSITAPSGYSDSVFANGSGDSADISMGAARKEWSSGAEDPPAFTTWSAGFWTALSVAVKPNDHSPSAEINHFRDVGTGSLLIDEQAIADVINTSTGNIVIDDAATGSLQFTENTPSAEIDHFRNVAGDELQFSSTEPVVKVSIIALPDTGSLEFTEATPSAEIDHFIDVGGDELQFTGNTPSAEINHFRDVGIDELQFSGITPLAFTGIFKQPGIDELQFTGYQPDVTNTSDAAGIVIDDVATGSITFTPESAYYLNSGDCRYFFTGYAPLAVTPKVAEPGTRALTFTTTTPTRKTGIFFEGQPVTLDHETDYYEFPATGGIQFGGEKPLVWGNVPPAIKKVPPTGSLQVTTYGYELNVIRPRPDSVAVTITGYQPNAVTSLVDTPRYPFRGRLSITGAAPARVDVSHSGQSITNPNATTAVPSNYEQCDYTGFRQLPGSLKMTWNRHAVRRKSYESRHPQEKVRNLPEKRKGSRRPEQPDQFIDSIVDPEDL